VYDAFRGTDDSNVTAEQKSPEPEPRTEPPTGQKIYMVGLWVDGPFTQEKTHR